MFTLAISCLTTSNLPWFMDLTFQVPMQYCSYNIRLYFHHITPTIGCCLHFGSASSFFLELFLHSSPVAYWAPTDPGSSSFSVLSFCLFILFMGFSRQEYWNALAFPSPVDHVLSVPYYQGHVLQPLSIAGWHAWCSGCPTAGPHWVCKPSLGVGCQLTCSQGLRQRPWWSGWEGIPGKAGAHVGRCPGVEGPPDLATATDHPGADPLSI